MDVPLSRRPAVCLRVAGITGLLGTIVLAMVAAEWGSLLAWDRTIAVDLHGPAVDHPGWTRVSRILTDWVWDPWTVRALLVSAALWFLWRGDRVTGVCVLIATAVVSGLQQGLKLAVGRDRPHWPDPVATAHFSAFPSGHAMTAALGCALLWWLALRAGARGLWLWGATALAVISIAGVGFTRLWVGVHWFSDVLGGWLFGVALAALTAAACLRWGPPGAGTTPVDAAGDPADAGRGAPSDRPEAP
ncbi:phosphatase PAP2 family protein [Streptomyces sp. NPDC048639]|uniref:phosphatase PAP2 family protein n=1 Tax=Streptomyces sp. NPDC048639 TaxID=3365581 RepID=UPI0037145AA9